MLVLASKKLAIIGSEHLIAYRTQHKLAFANVGFTLILTLQNVFEPPDFPELNAVPRFGFKVSKKTVFMHHSNTLTKKLKCEKREKIKVQQSGSFFSIFPLATVRTWLSWMWKCFPDFQKRLIEGQCIAQPFNLSTYNADIQK